MAGYATKTETLSPVFGSFQAPWWFKALVRAKDLGQPHPISGLRKSLGKRYLRRTPRQFDVTYRGFALRLSPNDNADDRSIVLTGVHPEEDEFEVFEKIAPLHSSFVDIGANIGIYSLMAHQLMPAGSSIVAFEPSPPTLAKLRRHLTINDAAEAVTVIPAGVGPETSTVRLNQVDDSNAGQNSMRMPAQTGGGIDVPVVTLLDTLADEGVDHIGVLKIDIEGFEDQALVPFFQSAPETLWPAYILIETRHKDLWDTDLVAVLTARGYKVAFQNRNNTHFERRAVGQNE